MLNISITSDADAPPLKATLNALVSFVVHNTPYRCESPLISIITCDKAANVTTASRIANELRKRK